MQQKVSLIFDIGKTNKKYFLFDENLVAIQSAYIQIPEQTDEDGFACDDLEAIENWIVVVYKDITANPAYEVVFVNFSTYGATFVHLDASGNPCTPLYNYLKPIPEDIVRIFEQKYGDWNSWAQQTASPSLGMLNAGWQLFWLKYQKPEVFARIHQSVFLPQYLSYRFTHVLTTDYTGLGCHTGMWDFQKNEYAAWIYAEGFDSLLPLLRSTYTLLTIPGTSIPCGTGIHDSSAALLPYLRKSSKPFLLLSTGTWNICLNPYNDDLLTLEELNEDCLCYLQPDGKPVKASRFFMGNVFNTWVQVLNTHFHIPADYHKTIPYQASLYTQPDESLSLLFTRPPTDIQNPDLRAVSATDLSRFRTYEEAYHQLIQELLVVQVQKIKLVLNRIPIDTMYVDGGFADNKVCMAMLQEMLPAMTIIPSEMPLGTALGAALIKAHETVQA